jgi:hypothetical protein
MLDFDTEGAVEDFLADGLKKCPCGSGVMFYSSLLEKGFCSDRCYEGCFDEVRTTNIQPACC